MATINVGINVGTQGMQAANAQAATLAANLQAAAAAATKVGTATRAAQQGVANSNASRAPASSFSSGVGNPPGNSGSGLSRGIAGQTGAEGRDFAKQAQGLGGLVHIYATFAANIFAVSAAFTALSKAADTSNLVKGLDQLGAASGKSLGSVSKRIIELTEGAVSLKEAMVATAQASSAGISTKNIERLASAAKNTSQALGIGMPDALSRLTRGIAKIEPELLDELGIMVKVDKASQDYARTLGKTASQLTDFEKRQGFTNAVLAEAEAKFGAIKLDSNPYSKILASMQNISQTGLELINKVLSPLLGILSSSPTALAGAMGLIATVLLKQAIPAFGMLRENARRAAAETSTRAQNLYRENQEIQERQDAHTTASAIHTFNTQNNLTTKLARLAAGQQSASGIRGLSAGTKDLIDRVPGAITEPELATLEARAKRMNAVNRKLVEEHVAGVREVHRIEQEAAQAGEDAVEARIAASQRIGTHEDQLRRISARASRQATFANISDITAETQAREGALAAFRRMHAEVQLSRRTDNLVIAGYDEQGNAITRVAASTTRLGRATAYVTGSLRIATTAVGTFLNAFGPWVAAIGMIVTAATAVYNLMSVSQKESEAFSKSMDALTESTSNAERTLEAISKKDVSKALDATSTQAQATAFNELSDSLTSSTIAYTKLVAARGSMEKNVEGIMSFFGKGDSDVLAKKLGTTIVDALHLIQNDKTKAAATDAIQKIIGSGVNLNSAKAVTTALKGLKDPELMQFAESLKAVFEKTNLVINNSAESLTSFVTGMKATATTVATMNAKLTPQDDQSKIGSSMITQSFALGEALKQPISGLTALIALANDSANLSLLPGASAELIKNKKQLEDINSELAKARKDATDAEAKITKSKDNIEEHSGVFRDAEDFKIVQAERSNIKIQQAAIASARERIALQEKSAVDIIAKFKKLDEIMFQNGADKLLSGITVAMTAAAVESGKAYLSVLKAAGGDTATQEGKLRQADLQAQKEVIKMEFASIRALEENTLALQEETLSRKEQFLKGENSSYRNAVAPGLAEERAVLEQRKANLGKKPETLLKEFKSTDYKDTSSSDTIAAKALKESMSYITSIIGQQTKLIGISAKEYASNLQTEVEKLAEQNTHRKKGLQISLDTNTADSNRISLQQKLRGEFSEELDAQIASANSKALAAKQELTYSDLQHKLNLANFAIRKAITQENKDKANDAKTRAQGDINSFNKTKAEETKKLESDAIARKIQGLESIKTKAAENAALEKRENNDITSAKLADQKSSLDYYNTTGALVAGEYEKQSGIIALDQQRITNENEILAIKQKSAEAERTIAANKKIAEETNKKLPEADKIDTSAYDKQSKLEAESLARKLEAAAITNKSKLTEIELNTANAKLLAEQTKEMNDMTSITDSLSGAFGTLGESIGKAGEALLKMAHDDEKYNKERISLNEKLAEAMSFGDTEEEAKATAKLNTLDKKFAKDKLSNIASVAGAHKKLFAEHTVAYKVLGAVEKAAHTYKLAMQFKEMATDALAFAKKIFFVEAEVPAVAGATAAKTGIELAGQAATMPAKIAGTYASFMSMLGPFGPPAAALAIAAFIGSAFGGGGGGSVSSGPSQEQLREVQGTGQAYNSVGTLVDTGKGVFGDPTTVNKGIKESLDLLAATAKPELAYTSKMVMLLANIDNSLSGAANSLTASGFKIDPASYASLGRTKESGGINNISTPALLVATGMVGTVVAKVLGKVFGNIGGSASSYFEVTGGGFEVPLQKLTDAVDNFTSKGYVVANKIASDGGIQAIRNPDEFGGRGTEVNAEFNAEIGRALKDASNTAREISIAFGAVPTEVSDTLSSFMVKMDDIDLFGAKTLEEKSEILNAKIGGVIDDILEQTLPKALFEFRKGGETLLTTATRVSSGIEEANFYLNQLGVTSVKYTEVLRTLGDVSSEIVRQSIVLKEGTNGVAELINAFSGTAEEISSFYTELSSLRTIFEDTGVSTNILTSKFLNLGGGLSKISGEVSDYYKNFYSDSERNLDSAKAVSAKLGKVNLIYSPEEIVSMTKAQFRGIVEGLGTVTPESEAAYVALMGVSGAINEIASSAKNSNADQIQLLKLQGKEVEALRLTRLNELDGLVGTTRLIRTQIHDQEDLNKTKSLELGLATALGMTTEVLNYTRQKELDTLSLMDRAIKQATYAIEDFNKTRDLEVALLTAQGDILAAVTHAREKELKGLSESNKLIQQRIYLLQDEASTIAAAKAVEGARVTVANAYAGFVNAAKTSGETLVSAEENITRGYLAAKDKADKALIASNDVVLGEADRVSKAGIETGKKLKDFAKNIRKFIDEITYGSIDTNHQLVYLQRVFDDTLAKARTGNEDALNTLTDSASKLLEKGKDTSVTFLDFARLTGRTAADLTSVADALDAKADPLLVSILGLTDEQIAANDAAKDYAKRSLEAQTALNDANKELADWTKAVKESTASTEEILIDYAKDWRKANTEDIKARSELLEATKIIGATNSKVPTALDGLRDAMTAMGTAIQSLATNLGAFTGAVLSAVQSQQLSAADAVTKLAAVGTNLAKDSISTVDTSTGNTAVYASSTGKALAIDNKDGKDYTVYGTTIKATGQEIRDWIAKQTNPIDIYNGAVSQGISSQMLADIASFPVSEIRDWVSANNLPAFAFGGDHSGGIRLVGENGPEIESTGPSRIFNASQTRGMLQQDNSELIAEIRLLRSEVKELKEINKASSDSEKTTAKQLTRWDTDGMPPIRT